MTFNVESHGQQLSSCNAIQGDRTLYAPMSSATSKLAVTLQRLLQDLIDLRIALDPLASLLEKLCGAIGREQLAADGVDDET